MNYTGNSVPDGDDGSSCFSPYHDERKCPICREAKEEEERPKRKRKSISGVELVYSFRNENENEN